MKENPACQMALPYKNAHGSGPDHWPLSHPFCIGFPVFCPLFTICQTQNITQRLIQIIACPDIMVDKILHKAFSCLCCCQKLYNLHRIVSGKTSLQHLHHQPVTHPLFFDLLFFLLCSAFNSFIPEIITLPWKYLKHDEDSILLHERKSRQLPADRHK